MKKLVLLLTVVVFLAGVVACGGGGKYDDAKAVMNDMIDAFNGFGDAMDKANDGKAVAAAIEDFADKMAALKPKIDEMQKKYPDFKSQPPEELKELVEKVGEASQKMSAAMMKIGQYATDPDVQKVMPKLQNIK